MPRVSFFHPTCHEEASGAWFRKTAQLWQPASSWKSRKQEKRDTIFSLLHPYSLASNVVERFSRTDAFIYSCVYFICLSMITRVTAWINSIMKYVFLQEMELILVFRKWKIWWPCKFQIMRYLEWNWKNSFLKQWFCLSVKRR